MKVKEDFRRFREDFIIYELDKEDKERFNTNKKYFITNGIYGLFGSNIKFLITAFRVYEGK